MCESLFCSHSCWLNSQADKLACWDDFCGALHKCWPEFNPRGTSGSREHTVSKVMSVKCMSRISHSCFWELLPQDNASGLAGFLPLCNLPDGCPALWLNLPVHASPFFSFHIHFAQPHIRAGRCDDIYRHTASWGTRLKHKQPQRKRAVDAIQTRVLILNLKHQQHQRDVDRHGPDHSRSLPLPGPTLCYHLRENRDKEHRDSRWNKAAKAGPSDVDTRKKKLQTQTTQQAFYPWRTVWPHLLQMPSTSVQVWLRSKTAVTLGYTPITRYEMPGRKHITNCYMLSTFNGSS